MRSRYVQVNEGDNIISGRDVESRMEELESDRESIIDRLDDLEREIEELADHIEQTATVPPSLDSLHDIALAIHDRKNELREWDESDDGDEYRKLKAFWEEIEGYGGRDLDLISDDYFREYAYDQAESIHGDVMSQWPFTCIDWGQAAHDLQHGYTSVDFGCTTYWYRS